MNIDDVSNKINDYQNDTFIRITKVTLNNKCFSGNLILNDGTIFRYDVVNPESGNFTKIAQMSLENVNNLKKYLLDNNIFQKKFQQTKIDNLEFKCYININNQILDIKNDFINVYEPSLYKALNYWINYYVNLSNGLNPGDINYTIKNNFVKIKSNLDGFKVKITIGKTFFKKTPIMKAKIGKNIYNTKSISIIYWTIRLLYDKYDSIFMAPGAKISHKNIINSLSANYRNILFDTIDERNVLSNTLRSLFDDIKYLK